MSTSLPVSDVAVHGAPSTLRRWACWLPVVLVTLAGAIGVVVLERLPIVPGERALTEAGIVEQSTAWALFTACAIGLVRLAMTRTWAWIQTCILLVAYALRELDFHYRFTAESATSIRFFIDPVTPGLIRLGVFAVACIIVSAGIYWTLGNFKTFHTALRSKRTWAHCLLGAMVLLGFSQLIDKVTNMRSIGHTIEETMELCAAVLVVLALLSFRRRTPTVG